jgi:hypothetical protein
MICKHCGKDPEVEPKAELDWLLQNRFDVFWKLFPRREDKGHAIKAFKRHVTSEDKFALIMKALNQQLPELLKRERKHVPYPATWLNGLHWENETQAWVDSTMSTEPRVIACELCGDTGITTYESLNGHPLTFRRCSCDRGALPGLVIPQAEADDPAPF